MIKNRKVYRNGKIIYKYQKPQANHERDFNNIITFIEFDLENQIKVK